MKIAVTGQNFRTISGHAGRTRRFLVFEQDAAGTIHERTRLDLPKAMSMHEFPGGPHPLDGFDVLITGGAGEGFRNKMAARGIRLVITSASDPLTAVGDLLAGRPLPPPLPHDH